MLICPCPVYQRDPMLLYYRHRIPSEQMTGWIAFIISSSTSILIITKTVGIRHPPGTDRSFGDISKPAVWNDTWVICKHHWRDGQCMTMGPAFNANIKPTTVQSFVDISKSSSVSLICPCLVYQRDPMLLYNYRQRIPSEQMTGWTALLRLNPSWLSRKPRNKP